jgi:dimethylargininase
VTLIALTRGVSDAISRCELTHVARKPIDLVPPAHDLPDAVFVEDTAVVVKEVAIATRPGAMARRPEVRGVSDVLGRYREVLPIEAPATIDGGDVLVAGKRVFIGRTGRTNSVAILKMREILEPIGYTVDGVDVTGCLHLKSAVTALADDRLLLNRAWIGRETEKIFRDFDLVEIDPDEPYAANIVRAGGALIYPSAFPRTRATLERLGLDVTAVDVGELAKAEGAVTCCSLIFEA